ncbi:hypothetical protein [Saccharothrix hoggarensis]|uniref:Phage terminase small subunit n=1 Tax=Saccharothrix hoggarensis TaxID=913853 RepID=A0ABW3QFV8_9PSEU
MSASAAQRAKTAERRAQAIQLKLAGLDFETIAQRLGYSSRQAAHKDLQRALARNLALEAAAADELRHVELMRLDRLQGAFWAKAVGGDIKAGELCLRIIAERRKLLGLDAPAQVEVITLDAVDAEIRRLEAELGRLGDAAQADEAAAATGAED